MILLETLAKPQEENMYIKKIHKMLVKRKYLEPITRCIVSPNIDVAYPAIKVTKYLL